MTYSCVWYDSIMCATWLMERVRLSFMCDMTHSYVHHNSFICVTWLVDVCDVTYSYVQHDWIICVVSWLNFMYIMIPGTTPVAHTHTATLCNTHCNTLQHSATATHCNTLQHTCTENSCRSYGWHESIICATWLMERVPLSFIRVTWLIRMCDMTHLYVRHDSYVWRDSCMCATWLIHMCNMTKSYVHMTPGSFTPVVYMFDMARSNVWHDSFTWVAT